MLHPSVERAGRRLVATAGLLLLLAAGGCGILGIGDATVRTYEVAAHKGTCYGLFATLCLQVREPGDTEFQNLFETPSGFDYEWGFDYVIEVEEHDVENPPADGSSIRRVLREVLSKVPVASGSTFELTLGGGGLRPLGQDRYSLFAGPETAVCAGTLACDELAGLVRDERWLQVGFAHPEEPGLPFLITGWTRCPEEHGPCVGGGPG